MPKSISSQALKKEGSSTIPKGSTPQAENGGGSGTPQNQNSEENQDKIWVKI